MQVHPANRPASLQQKIVGIMVVFFLAFFYTLVYRQIRISYHDEAIRVGRGYLLELLLQGDLQNPLWFTFDGYDQPMLSQLVYGATLYNDYLRESMQLGTKDYLTYMINRNLYDASKLDGDAAVASYLGYQQRKKDYIYWENEIDGENDAYVAFYGPDFQKTLESIYKARSINVVFLTLTALIIYFLALRFFSLVGSLIISLWFATNALVVSTGLRAMNEGLFLLLFVLGVYLLIDHFSTKSFMHGRTMLIGVISGLCMATKLNGVMLAIFFAVFSCVSALRLSLEHQYRKAFYRLLPTLLVLVVTLLTFVLCNPYTYGRPIQNTWNMYSYRLEQVERSKIYDAQQILPRLSDRWQAMYEGFFSPKEAWFFSMPYGATVPRTVSGTVAIILFLVGSAAFWSVDRKKSARVKQSKKLFLGLSISTIVLMLFYLGLNKNRYFVPLSVFILWFEGAGLYYIYRLIVRWLR